MPGHFLKVLKMEIDVLELSHRHRAKRKTRRVADAMKSAAALLPKDIKGIDLFAFTAGQWSLMEMICALIAKTGPVDVTMSIWTAADADMRDAFDLIESKHVKSLRMFIDRSFLSRQPEYAALAVKLFGNEALRITRTHCKVAVLRNDEYSIVCRGSMNLNHSPRWEQLEITDDREFADFIVSMLDKAAVIGDPGLSESGGVVSERLYAPFV